MYPATYFSLFPPFPREEKVFVAMAFALQRRWTQVIEPAIKNIKLMPYRVDVSVISDSILTEILSGIGKSRLIFADISTIEGNLRNGNVMYEVGIAHSMRQPQEIVLFRSDQKELLFDIGNIRVNSYDPEGDPSGAQKAVERTLREALNEIELTKGLAVERAINVLDKISFFILLEAHNNGAIQHPQLQTLRQAMGNSIRAHSIFRLLEMGLLTSVYPQFPAKSLKRLRRKKVLDSIVYIATPLGRAVIQEIANRFGLHSTLKIK